MSYGERLVINGRFLEKSLLGIGRFAIGVSETLARARADVSVVTSRRRRPALVSSGASLPIHHVGHLTGHLWEQISLPMYLRRRGYPPLLNLVNTAPLLYRDQVTVIYDLSYLRYPQSFSRGFVTLYRILIPRAAAMSRHIVTISEFSKGEIVQLLGIPRDHVSVVYPFVPPVVSALAHTSPTSEGNDYALMVSSLNPRKNIRRAIEAFHRAAVPHLRLILVGQRRAVFADPQLSGGLFRDNIELRGRVSDEELARLYHNARFFLYPSLYEGFGIPPLEAMASGCAVIASATTSLPEVCGDAALYVDPMNVDAIAAGIRRLATDESLRQQLAARGPQVARRFTIGRTTEQLAAVLRRVWQFELSPSPA